MITVDFNPGEGNDMVIEAATGEPDNGASDIQMREVAGMDNEEDKISE